MNGEHEKDYEENDESSHMMGCMGWPKKFKKEFMMAKMKKKEKILEAKLEFIREMRRLAEKKEMEGPETEEKSE